jgi:hypothetical protein
MVDVLKSLEEITTGYNVFEKDQVLTHLQLNQLSNYLDDQGRLTRVALLCVGIGCGLKPSLSDGNVVVTKGVGVTTDGDLLRLGADTLYDRFRPYDAAAPVYRPFLVDGNRIPLWEVVPVVEEDPRARPLARFKTDARADLGGMVALLLMESYVRDPDLCSGTDCDNLGRDAINTPRLLLVDATAAARLLRAFDTPDDAARRLPDVVAERPAITTALSSPDALATAYRTACTVTLARLVAGLDKLYPECSAFLSEDFAADPAPVWKRILTGLDAQFAQAPRGIQYYYDFLRDLVDTYNDFRGLLFGDTTVCAPDFLRFPKHLLLGRLAPTANPADYRTGFYPSPILSSTAERRHARFLARKLNTLILTFEVPTGPPVVRITPSLFADRPLEERAIPYYYKVGESLPIASSWSFRLRRRDMDAYNYSYSAPLYAAQGGAAAPLTSDIARFPFFRIEGHLGANVKDAVAALTNEVKARNLAIDVKSVMLDRDRTKLPFKPPFRFTDLHRIHYLVRQDVSSQLDDVARFSQAFKEKVNADAATAVAGDPQVIKGVARDRDAAIQEKSTAAKGTLSKGYAAYKADKSWTNTLRDTVQAAGTFKVDMGDVVKTDFVTPFDTLITNPHVHWLDWLDDIIGKKDETEEERVLFPNFLDEHPGLEHHAGTVRGGTFVLACDTQGIVVADFMLPYYCCERPEQEVDEPPFKPPIVKPPYIIDRGITLIPSRDRFFEDIKRKIEPEWKGAIDLERKYFDTFKDTVTLIGSVYSGLPKVTTPGGGAIQVTDPKLDAHLKETRVKSESVDFIRNEMLKAGDDVEKMATLEANLKEAEVDLAKSIATTTEYVAKSPMEMGPNSDGFAAMSALSTAVTKISNTAALKEVKTGLEGAAKEAAAGPNSGAAAAIGNMLKGKGLVR